VGRIVKAKKSSVAVLAPTPPAAAARPAAQAMQIEMWPISRPIPYKKNARKWSDRAIETVANSIREFGFRQPIVVDIHDVIIIGHLRLKAAESLKLEKVPVHVARELTPLQCRGLRLADNRTSQESTWDLEMLGEEILELKALDFNVGLTGFDLQEIKGFLLKGEGGSGLTDPDAIPEPPVVPVSHLGDLWLLGEHRVLCGDSTSAVAVARLCGATIPDLCVTDPPYGISIVKQTGASKKGVVGGAKPYGSSEGVVVGGGQAGAMYPYGGAKKGVGGGENIVKPKLYAPVINDESTETAAAFYLCAVAFGIKSFIIFGGNYFTAFLPASPCWVVWDKQNSGNFADVEMAWTSFDKGSKLYAWMWNGLSRAGDRKSELETRVHPTQKPVGLFEKIFADFPATVCLDLFLGSGSILIACEKTKRACYGMELSPDYVDVIVSRWEAFTGKQATLEGDGRTFAALKADRLRPSHGVMKPDDGIRSASTARG
jgi:hypothetical protein